MLSRILSGSKPSHIQSNKKEAGLTLEKSGLLLPFYDSVVFDLPFHQLTCSCSHSACLSVHGYYWRSVKLPSGTLRLRVCRVKCSECGTTHALLLSSMVPFSQIPLSDQQRICNDYEEGRCVSMVCETNPSIDENNVKSIPRNYRLCWREKLRSLRTGLFPLDTLILSCFSDYSSQFMQIHRRVNRLFFLYHIALPDSASIVSYNKEKL